MKKDEAITEYNRNSYNLSNIISQLSEMKTRTKFINEQMGWDGMFEIDFDEAVEKLGEVLAAMVCYANEDKYKASTIKKLEEELRFLKEN